MPYLNFLCKVLFHITKSKAEITTAAFEVRNLVFNTFLVHLCFFSFPSRSIINEHIRHDDSCCHHTV